MGIINDHINLVYLLNNQCFKGDEIRVHLYNKELDRHLVIFKYEIDKCSGWNLPFVNIMCSPSTRDDELSWTYIFTSYVCDIDEDYKGYEIVRNSAYVGRNYKVVEYDFLQLQHELHAD